MEAYNPNRPTSFVSMTQWTPRAVSQSYVKCTTRASSFALPLSLGRRNSAYYQADTVEKRGMLVIDTKLTLPIELVQPHDYIELVDIQRELNSLSRRRVLLEVDGGKGK